MPSIYLCDVHGNGTRYTSEDRSDPTSGPFRPAVPVGTRYACLMIDKARGKAMIVSPDDALSGTGIRQLVTGNSRTQLLSRAGSQSPNTATRATINSWLTAAGYQTLPAGGTWRDVILFIARQVNPVADLDKLVI